MTIQLKSLFLFMAVVGSLSLFSGDVVRANSATQALWVFSDELTNSADRQTLIQRSATNGVTDLYVSVYQSTTNGAGRLMYQDNYIADLITQAHAQGIRVWAAYGAPDWPELGCDSGAWPMLRMAEVNAYNGANSTAKFDGVALDVEPQTADLALLTLYQCIQSYLGNNGLNLAVAIRFYWDTPVEFGTSTKPLYQHIIDLPLNKVVVMGYRDSAGTACPSNGIICLDQDEANYSYSVGKVNLILVGLETSNCAPGCGDASVTFFEEGESTLNQESLLVGNSLAGKIGGFAIHRYKDSYLGGPTGWPTHDAVIYNFTGFYPPVDNLPTINVAKAGQAIPIKWSLKDADGNFVSDLATARSYGYGSVACSSGTTDAIEQYAEAGSTSLRYDTIANQFILTSKTDKTWADSCKTFTLVLSDGTKHQAKFQFKK